MEAARPGASPGAARDSGRAHSRRRAAPKEWREDSSGDPNHKGADRSFWTALDVLASTHRLEVAALEAEVTHLKGQLVSARERLGRHAEKARAAAASPPQSPDVQIAVEPRRHRSSSGRHSRSQSISMPHLEAGQAAPGSERATSSCRTRRYHAEAAGQEPGPLLQPPVRSPSQRSAPSYLGAGAGHQEVTKQEPALSPLPTAQPAESPAPPAHEPFLLALQEQQIASGPSAGTAEAEATARVQERLSGLEELRAAPLLGQASPSADEQADGGAQPQVQMPKQLEGQVEACSSPAGFASGAASTRPGTPVCADGACTASVASSEDVERKRYSGADSAVSSTCLAVPPEFTSLLNGEARRASLEALEDPVLARWVRMVTGAMDESTSLSKLHPVWAQPESWLRKIRWNNASVDVWAQIQQERPVMCRQMSRRGSAVTTEIGVPRSPTQEALLMLKTKGLSAFLEAYVVVEPQSTVRILWACAGIFLMIYDLIVLPLQAFTPPEHPFLVAMQWFSQIFWSMDIVFTFLTAVYVNSELVRQPRQIAWSYATSWLPFDVSVAVPMWLVCVLDSDSSSTLSSTFRYIRMLRFLRLLRLAKFERMLSDALAAINSPVLLLGLGMVKLMLCLILISHVNACLWFWIGKQDEVGWSASFLDSSIFYQYLTSMHWALTQFQGTSEIIPGRTTAERAYAVCTVLFSLLILCSFVSSLTNKMMQMQSLHTEKYQQQRLVGMYLSHYRISASLSVRVKKYMQWKQKMQRQLDDHHQALRFLPIALQMDLVVEVRLPVICMHHDFFARFTTIYPRLSRRIIHRAFQQISPAPQEIIFSAQETCFRMYFAETGELSYVVRDRRESGQAVTMGVHKVTRGQHLSEPCLWMHWQHKGDLMCDGFSSLLALPAQGFEALITMHPPAHASSVLYARRYIAGLTRFRWCCTDLINPNTLIAPDELLRFDDRLAESFSSVAPKPHSMCSQLSVVGERTSRSSATSCEMVCATPTSKVLHQNWVEVTHMPSLGAS